MDSQVRTNIECAFGILVHRWGILRKAIPINISLGRTTALVLALCKVHNFCIDESDMAITRPIADDSLGITIRGGLGLRAFKSLGRKAGSSDNTMEYDNDSDRINDLLDGGHHMNDVPRDMLQRDARKTQEARHGTPLPYEVMVSHVTEQGFQRPRVR